MRIFLDEKSIAESKANAINAGSAWFDTPQGLNSRFKILGKFMKTNIHVLSNSCDMPGCLQQMHREGHC